MYARVYILMYECMFVCMQWGVWGQYKCMCASKIFKYFEMFFSCHKYTGIVDTTFSKYKLVTKSFIHHGILYLNFRNVYMFLNYRNRDK